MPTNTYTLTHAHSGLPLELSNALIFIKNDNLTLNLDGSTNDIISVYGHQDDVSLVFTNNVIIQDHGTGTDIYSIALPYNLTIDDFQTDRTGILRIGHTGATPVLSSDHHGGTLATFGVPGASIDFVGDRQVSVSHAPGTIVFLG